MKKWAEWLLVAGALCMGMAGCGSEEKNTSNADAEQKSETASETREEGQAPEQTDTEGSEEAELQTTESDHAETGLTFADLVALQFEFCSGAGGWSTDFTIEKDGSFSGVYHDSDMGDTGDGYPNGTMYYCNFSGHFTNLTKVDDDTYEMSLADISYQNTVGDTEILDDMLYVYTDVYGLEGTDTFRIYLPGTPREKLTEDEWFWIAAGNESETELTMTVIVNEPNEYGIYSYERSTPSEEAQGIYNSLLNYNDELEQQLQSASTQQEMNEITAQMYQNSDDSLNQIWHIVKYNSDETEFAQILEEQKSWITEKEAEAEERRQALLAEREKKEKEEYAKKIQQDRIELMRLKQGIITESDTIYEEKEEKPKMSFWKKLGNFLYHSKWWLGITVFIVGVFVFLIVDYVTKVRPDMIVLLITDDTEMQNHRQQLEEYLEQFTDDENGDGKVHVDIYPIPVSDNIDDMDYFTGNSTKLSAEFQMGEAVMVITDAKANEYIMADETLTDLSEKYTGHENIRGNGYYLRHTDFATKIDYPGNVDRDLSIGLRAPVKTSDSKEKMQKTYDVAEKVLLRVMDDLDNTTEPEDIVTTEPAETAVTTTKED